MTGTCWHPWGLAAVALSALVAPGCGPGGSQQPADRATAAVEEFLDSWSKGELPGQFAEKHPQISAADPDWEAGYRLLSFMSVDARQSPEEPARFRCRVALSLRDRMGKTVDKEVTYEVVAGEKVVISRAQR